MNKDWALAADAEINDDLIGTGLRLPESRVVPQELGWAPGRLAEEYFHTKHVETDNDAGIAAYERLGFVTHHTNRYLIG